MRAKYGIVFIMVLAGCQTSPQVIQFGGGNGSCCQKAVVITNAKFRESGLLAERLWLDRKYPQRQEIKTSAVDSAGRHYDVVELATGEGQKEIVYFDTTESFAK